VAVKLIILQEGEEPLSSDPVWAEPSQLLIGTYPTWDAASLIERLDGAAFLDYGPAASQHKDRKVTSSTAGLRFHDLRHHAITALAESFV